MISQSNYIPWKGYFDSLALVDTYVAYDDMQYTKRDWRNRNKIKTPNGLKWLSIPVEVKGRYFQKIRDTKVADHEWKKSHLGSLKSSYKDAAQFSETWDFVEGLYARCNFDFLSDINLFFIREIADYLDISVDIRTSSEFSFGEEKTERLLDICTEIEATEYYTGPAARAYIKDVAFADAGIALKYFDFSNYKEYPQLHPPFEHGVSILDTLFHLGKNTRDFMKY